MNDSDAAKFRSFSTNIGAWLILAALAVCCIHFVLAMLNAALRRCTEISKPMFIAAPAHKRIVNRIAHLRKFALFTRSGAALT